VLPKHVSTLEAASMVAGRGSAGKHSSNLYG